MSILFLFMLMTQDAVAQPQIEKMNLDGLIGVWNVCEDWKETVSQDSRGIFSNDGIHLMPLKLVKNNLDSCITKHGHYEFRKDGFLYYTFDPPEKSKNLGMKNIVPLKWGFDENCQEIYICPLNGFVKHFVIISHSTNELIIKQTDPIWID